MLAAGYGSQHVDRRDFIFFDFTNDPECRDFYQITSMRYSKEYHKPYNGLGYYPIRSKQCLSQAVQQVAKLRSPGSKIYLNFHSSPGNHSLSATVEYDASDSDLYCDSLLLHSSGPAYLASLLAPHLHAENIEISLLACFGGVGSQSQPYSFAQALNSILWADFRKKTVVKARVDNVRLHLNYGRDLVYKYVSSTVDPLTGEEIFHQANSKVLCYVGNDGNSHCEEVYYSDDAYEYYLCDSPQTMSL